MSLYNFLYNLQRRPYRTRKRVLTGLVVFSFLALVAFWVFMFKSQVSGGLNSLERSGGEVLGQEKNLISPAAALIDGFRGLKDDVAKKIGEYKSSSVPDNVENTRPVYELPEN